MSTAQPPVSTSSFPDPNKSSSSADTSSRKLKILMLHGYTQSGPLFHAKTRALEKNLEKAFPSAPKPGHLPLYPGGVSLHYPTGPIPLNPSDIPGYDVDGAGVPAARYGEKSEEIDAHAWWRRKGDSEPFVYSGLETGLSYLAEYITTNGPFDGVIGFSQGGACSAMLASLLEPTRQDAFTQQEAKGGIPYPPSFTVQNSANVIEAIHPPLKFAVSYSGFAAPPSALYDAFYNPKIATPMLHFIGSVDTVVEESRSLRLVDSCEGGRGSGQQGKVDRLVYHPGGHFLPSSQKPYVAALVAFIREICGGGGGKAGAGNAKEEEKAEDMDMPF